LRQQILVLLSALLWSTSFPVIKTALRYATPLELAACRFFFAALFADIFLLLRRGKKKEGLREALFDFDHSPSNHSSFPIF